MVWNFNAEEGKEGLNDFSIIPVGDHRIRFAKIEEVKSKTNKDMLKITFDVSGHSSKLFYYFVFDDSSPDATRRTNANLMKIFDSFGIQEGDMNFQNWIGKVGACRVKHEVYNGEINAKVSYILLKDKQKNLPAWKESGINENTGSQSMNSFAPELDELQF